MTMQSESIFSRLSGKHPHSAEERCPLCNQVLPQDVTAEELRIRLHDRERDAVAASEKCLRDKLEVDSAAKFDAFKKQAAIDAAARENVIRAEANALAQTALRGEIAKANEERQKAIQAKEAAVEASRKLSAEQEQRTDQAIKGALQAQRETLEKDKTNEVHRVQAREFEKTQKLQKQVELLKRQLEQKTPDELGEGAEIDLYETLRENFESDRVRRIKKGQPGADILHEVVHNGQVCGSIIYDSKNRDWRDSFAEKLKADQLAAKADHAVIATNSFPRGTGQLCVWGDVIVCNPARVVELVRIIRDHIIQTYRLRLSAQEREGKTETLYKFINSDRCLQLMNRYESIMAELANIDVKETKAHQKTWNERGQLIRDAQKVHADFRAEVDRIVEGSSVQ
jgi:hypothetical protein